MLNLLRDPVWQFIGAVLALVAAVITLIAQKTRKRLSYEVVARTPLITIKDELVDRLRVLYEEKPVENPSLVVLTLTNTGNAPIEPQDFKGSLSISLSSPSVILTAGVTETDPPGLNVCHRISGSQLLVEPLLLNPGDSISLKMLVGECHGPLKVDARISGVKAIDRHIEGFRSFISLSLTGIACVTAALIWLVVDKPSIPSGFLAVLGYLFLILAWVVNRKLRRRLFEIPRLVGELILFPVQERRSHGAVRPVFPNASETGHTVLERETALTAASRRIPTGATPTADSSMNQGQDQSDKGMEAVQNRVGTEYGKQE